jgi:hypothetical protein
VKVLTEEVFAKITLRTFGPRATAALFGWALFMLAWAPKDADRAWFLSHGPFSQATRYRHVSDMLKLRDAIVAEGYSFDEWFAEADAAELGGLARLMRTVTS